MDGQPVWLASVSWRDGPRVVPYPRWATAVRAAGARELRQVLEGVGDPTRERLFRMNITLCLHRAATDAEVAGQPERFHTVPAVGLAGGPVEVLSETVQGGPSTRPCRRPTKYLLDARDPLLWAPLDCGTCAPCRARTRLSEAEASGRVGRGRGSG